MRGDVHDQYRFWSAVVAYLRAERVARAIGGYQHKPKHNTGRCSDVARANERTN